MRGAAATEVIGILRMAERSPSDAHRWAGQLIEVLQRGIADHHRAREQGQPRVASSVMAYLGHRYQYWANRGLVAFPASSGGANNEEYTLLHRLDRHRGDILCFLSDVRLEPTNNQAERDLWMMKLRQKINGCFRSWSAAQRFARVRSYLSTARKQGLGFLTAIRSALNGQPFIPLLSIPE